MSVTNEDQNYIAALLQFHMFVNNFKKGGFLTFWNIVDPISR